MSTNIARRENEGKNTEALAQFNYAILQNDKYVEAYKNRGDILSKVGDYTGVIRDYTKVIRGRTASIRNTGMTE